MAVIHRTTLSPTKLEVITDWLPRQPWYRGPGSPRLVKAGGFRLDDPDGEVGIEIMIVADEADESDGRPVVYLVPLTYRGVAVAGAPPDSLIGTMQHGVLGRRWVYDGVHDPVLIGRLLELAQGRAEPQAQNVSDTPDPSVAGAASLSPAVLAARARVVRDDRDGTDVLVETVDTSGEPADPITVHVIRVLADDDDADAVHPVEGIGDVTAGWILPGGAALRGRLLVLR